MALLECILCTLMSLTIAGRRRCWCGRPQPDILGIIPALVQSPTASAVMAGFSQAALPLILTVMFPPQLSALGRSSGHCDRGGTEGSLSLGRSLWPVALALILRPLWHQPPGPHTPRRLTQDPTQSAFPPCRQVFGPSLVVTQSIVELLVIGQPKCGDTEEMFTFAPLG